MADDSLKVKIQLEATSDKKQVEQEATVVGETAQKTLDKKELKLKINDNLTELKKKLEETRVAYQNLLNQPMTGTTNQQLEKLEDQMEDLRNEIKENEKALLDLGGAGGKLGNIFQGMIGKITARGVALKVISFAKKTFTDFQDAQKELVKATGATGEALKGLSEDMLKVQGQVWQSQTEVAQAVGELNTRLGLTGEELQNFTTKYLKFASVTGQDGKTAIADNIRLFNIRGISTERQADYLDKLAKAGQMTGVNVGTLTNQLTTNQVALQELGFDLEQSIALLSNFERAGVDTSSALQAMKIGLNNLVEGGGNPAEALQEIVDRIQNAKSETEGLQIAAEIFGSRGGQAMFNAIRNGTLDVEAMTQALANAKGTVEDTHAEMETLADFIGRKWNGLVAETTNLINEAFRATRNWLNETQERGNKLINDFNILWKTSSNLKEVWHGLSIEGGYLTVTLDKHVQSLRRNKEVTDNLKSAILDMKSGLEDFNKTKVDDSANRAEFEASKSAALQAADAYKVALLAKIEYTKGEMQAMPMVTKEYVNMQKSLQAYAKGYMNLQKRINEVKNTKYSGKGGGGGLGDDLFGGSGGGGGEKSKAEEMLESFDKELETTRTNLDNLKKQHQTTYDNIQKNIEKAEKEYDKLRETATKTWKDAEESIRSYNEQLEKNQTDSLKKLGARYIELQEEWKTLEDTYLRDSISEISDSEWKDIKDRGFTWKGYTYKDLKDIKELYDEIKTIEENTTEEQRKSADFTDKTSKAQEIINNMKEKEKDLEEKKAAAMEKQAIAQAMMNQENGKQYIKTVEGKGTWYYDEVKKQWQQILDEDNIEYAKQLENQATNLNDQLKQYKDEKDNEVEILSGIISQKTQLENTYHTLYEKNLKDEEKLLDNAIIKSQKLLDLRKEYLSLGGTLTQKAYGGTLLNGQASLVGENGPEQIIARTASYVQPRNASNSYSTVNNTTDNSFSINGMQINVNNVDEFLDELRQRMTYRK